MSPGGVSRPRAAQFLTSRHLPLSPPFPPLPLGRACGRVAPVPAAAGCLCEGAHRRAGQTQKQSRNRRGEVPTGRAHRAPGPHTPPSPGLWPRASTDNNLRSGPRLLGGGGRSGEQCRFCSRPRGAGGSEALSKAARVRQTSQGPAAPPTSKAAFPPERPSRSLRPRWPRSRLEPVEKEQKNPHKSRE